ncbi:MAG: division/cell wall cluster transcriptional repressor MraZ [Erysipelotrichaceae bacterium]|nr:division/cell wall cluster transcriptional repressor MraZ [Erysipelotrichaceae bacterium]MBR3694237.1 division/cell wall cluster transcriptional repressor MraZ [Erysipelotrichales bacterium]
MFMGEFRHSVDAKGRIILPAKMREELGECVIVTRGLDGCLNVYTQERWQKIYEKLMTLPTTNRDARMYVRLTTSKATECTFDSHGRILLPQNLIKDAAIEKDAVIAGVGDHVEIWCDKLWDAVQEDECYEGNSYEEIAERLSVFGI